MNITDAIWRSSFTWPDRIALLGDGHALSYKELRQTVNLVGARLAKAGIRRGDCVAIALHSPLRYLVVALAVARLGAKVTELAADATDTQKEVLLQRHGVRALVQRHGATWRSATSGPLAYLDANALFTAPAANEQIELAPVAADADDETWLIALSSGTTSAPKSNEQSHWRGALNCSLPAHPDSAHAHRLLVFMGLGTSLGMNSLLRQMYAGGTVVLSQALTPENFFKVMAQDHPTQVVTTSGVAAALVTYASQHLPDSANVCAGVQTIYLSGSAVPPAVREAVMQRICPDVEIFYGSTEAGRIANANTETLASQPQSAGRILPWVEAQAVDENDQPLPAGKMGVLRFKTPVLAVGYLQDEKASALAFRQGWFYPGDQGSIDDAGFLTLGGRVDHVLNINGRRVDPVAIEQVINAHPAVLESAVVGAKQGDGHLALVAVVVAKSPVEPGELIRWCRERLEPLGVPRQIAVAASLPKNAGGKLMRAKLAQMVRLSASPTASPDKE